MPLSQGPPPTAAEVLDAARDMQSTLARLGLDCFLVGGLASWLYGNPRTPSDVDMTVSTRRHTQEELKRMLCSANARFYTVTSTNPRATYRVLWWRRSSTGQAVKTDVLQPGDCDIPALAASACLTLQGLSVAPLAVVLLLKLRAWADHADDTRSAYRLKRHTDQADMERLLPLAKKQGVRLDDEASSVLLERMRYRLLRHGREFPRMKENWVAIGASVLCEPPSTSSSNRNAPHVGAAGGSGKAKTTPSCPGRGRASVKSVNVLPATPATPSAEETATDC